MVLPIIRSRSWLPALRTLARGIVFVVALFWGTFAALSGAEDGLPGLVANLPNALPWIGLIVLFVLAIRWERLGGALIIAAALALLTFFNGWTNAVLLLAIAIPLIAAGALLMICGTLDRR
jgi:hypothetical protein